MPRKSKGPRLWLRPAQGDDRAATWIIRDGARQRGTGASEGEIALAEKALTAYLTDKHAVVADVGLRDPSQILIDDVLRLYLTDVAPNHARPYDTELFVGHLTRFWGGKLLSTVTGPTCRAYAKQRSTPSMARRELQVLAAAINYHRKEGLHDRIVSVVMPPADQPRERYLTRDEAAHLIRSAWRYKSLQGVPCRRHVAKFMVFSRYMGSRHGVVCSASIEPVRPIGRAWVDLKTGMFYARPVGERQTKKRKQAVRVPAPLLGHLRRWAANGQRYVVEWRGEPVENIGEIHKRIVREAGFTPDVIPHTWRHSVATWFMQSGVDAWKAAGFLAMSVQTLTRVYGHYHPDNTAEVHERMRRR